MSDNEPYCPQALFTGWVQEHGPAVRGYLRRCLGNRETADDLLQETFRRAWQARGSYQETGQARAYLFCIADRLVRDHYRKRKLERTLQNEFWDQYEPCSGDAPPPQQLLANEACGELRAALELLTPHQRRVLLLRYYGGMEFKEIARIVEAPLSTVLSHCRRGLLALRKQLSETET